MSAERTTSPTRPAPWASGAPDTVAGLVLINPVLLIGGEADRLVAAASMRRAAAGNPRWETVILPAVGHTPQLEAPDTVVGTMRDWLDRHFAPAIV